MPLLVLALFMPSAALAHAGDHSQPLAETIAHALTQPDHLAAALGFLALALGLYRWRKG